MCCARFELMARMESALAFGLITVGMLVKIAFTLIFFQALYGQVNTIGGWTLSQTYLLLGTFFLIESISWATYIRGFNRLSGFIERGELDRFLVQPVRLRGFLMYRFIDVFFCLPEVFAGIGLVVYGLMETGTWAYLPVYFFYLACAFVLHWSVILLLSTINFYVVFPQTYFLYSEILKLGRYPASIYKGAVGLVFSIVIPLTFIYSVPAEALFKGFSLWTALAAVGLSILFYALAVTCWNRGIQRYESANG